MIFSELNLNRFGKFKDKKLSFKPGINLVLGPNEAGKSTLFNAIGGILFGFKAHRNRYLPWNNPHEFFAAITMKQNEDEIHLERNFLDDLVTWTQNDQVFKAKAAPQGRSSERERYYQKIQNLFGFSDPDIFKNSLFIAQRSLHMPPSESSSVEIKQLISHVSEFRYDEIIGRLEERYFELTKKNPKGTDKRNDRLLEHLKKQIQNLETRIQNAHQGQTALKNISTHLQKLKENLSDQQQELSTIQKSLAAQTEAMQLSVKNKELSDQFKELSRKKTLVEKLSEEWQSVQQTKPGLNRMAVGLCCLSYFALPLLFFTTHISLIWLAPFLVGSTAYLFQSLFGHKKKLSHFQLQTLKTKSQLEVLPSIDELNLKLQPIQATQLELKVKLQILEKKILPVKNQDLKRQSLENQIARTQETLTSEKQNYMYMAKGLESPFTLEEDHFDLIEKQKSLKTKAQALWVAKNTLEKLVIEFRKEHLKIFAKDTETYFSSLVTNPYSNLELDESSLSPQLSQNNTPIQFSSLSSGTQDQFYFSMKFALLRLLGAGRKLPIFLDDPFVNFDHQRRKKCLELLKKYQNEHQIFLFTYDPWYTDALGDTHVIDLETSGSSSRVNA